MSNHSGTSLIVVLLIGMEAPEACPIMIVRGTESPRRRARLRLNTEGTGAPM